MAALAWFAFDGASSAITPLDRLESRLAAVRPGLKRESLDPGRSIAEAAAAPLFALSAGPGAVTDPAIRLDGVAISPEGSMALLSVNGQPSSWIPLGASSGGVTLIEVHDDRVTVDTPVALKEVPLWAAPTNSAPPAAAAQMPPSAAPHPPPLPQPAGPFHPLVPPAPPAPAR
jgi:hypothetical protein